MTMASLIGFLSAVASLGWRGIVLLIVLYFGLQAFRIAAMLIAVRHGYSFSANLLNFSFQPGIAKREASERAIAALIGRKARRQPEKKIGVREPLKLGARDRKLERDLT